MITKDLIHEAQNKWGHGIVKIGSLKNNQLECVDFTTSFLNDMSGQIFAMLTLTVAAAEAAIGLAILVVFFRNLGSIEVSKINNLKG